MKKILLIILCIAFTIFITGQVQAQPPHPNSGNAPSASNSPVGGGAPVGDGMGVLLLLSAIYLSAKMHSKKTLEAK